MTLYVHFFNIEDLKGYVEGRNG